MDGILFKSFKNKNLGMTLTKKKGRNLLNENLKILRKEIGKDTTDSKPSHTDGLTELILLK